MVGVKPDNLAVPPAVGGPYWFTVLALPQVLSRPHCASLAPIPRASQSDSFPATASPLPLCGHRFANFSGIFIRQIFQKFCDQQLHVWQEDPPVDSLIKPCMGVGGCPSRRQQARIKLRRELLRLSWCLPQSQCTAPESIPPVSFPHRTPTLSTFDAVVRSSGD